MTALKTDAKWAFSSDNDNTPKRLRKRVWEGNVCVGAIEYRMKRYEDGAKECQHVALVTAGPRKEFELPGSASPSMYGALQALSNYLKPVN